MIDELLHFLGFHKNCAKHIRIDGPNHHIYCKRSGKYLWTIHGEDDNDVKVTFPPNKEKEE